MAVYGTDLLWGCPQMNFKANPPFNEIRQGFATFKKETRMTPISSQLFENLRFFLKQKFCKQFKLDASF
jgi:hypothetical protein